MTVREQALRAAGTIQIDDADLGGALAGSTAGEGGRETRFPSLQRCRKMRQMT